MADRLLISALPGERRIAWLADGTLRDFYVERDDRPQILGNIYIGRVTQVDRSLHAAFVEIGSERPGFLPLGEAPKREVGRLGEGDVVIVKVLRQPAEEKGPLLSARIKNAPPGLAESARGRKPPALVSRGGDPLPQLLARRPEEILVDDQQLLGTLRLLCGIQGWNEAPLKFYGDPEPLLRREEVEEAVSAFLSPEVPLPSGGRLLIEPVRTLTAIDVNSARYGAGAGRGGRAATIEEVNAEAIDEILRQLRLRALSGLIVIDFLTPEDPAARKRLLSSLRQALKRDEETTRVIGLSHSGLAEVTRRRSRPPLHELMNAGIWNARRDPVALAFEALRDLRCEGLGNPPGRARLVAPKRVVESLSGPAEDAKAAVEKQLGYPIRMEKDELIETYDIVMDSVR